MLVKLSIENWMSFKGPSSLSMIATRELQHRERVPHLTSYDTRLLPAGVIFGGNASGKTNLFKALNFMKTLVVRGTQPDCLIPIEPFRLDDADWLERPVRFAIELLTNDKLYEFSFAVNRKAILEERLVEILKTTERVLFHRKEGQPHFHNSLQAEGALNFAFQGTRDNQLFLTNAVSQKIDIFRPVYDWFRYSLELIAPDSRFEPFERFLNEEHPLYAKMNILLAQLDTGIIRLGGEHIPFNSLPLPDVLKAKIQEELGENITIKVVSEPSNDYFIVTRKNGELVTRKLVSYHRKTDGSEVKFEIRQESDGTQRMINLLPAFLDLVSEDSTRIFVVDELDRSLHTNLTRDVIRFYLKNCSPNTRSQLLFTTHDMQLMDQKLFRRDEMWATERDSSGASILIPFSDYKDIRYDKDIRKSYLQGRLGGVPQINGSFFSENCGINNS